MSKYIGTDKDGKFMMQGICEGTNVGDYAYYVGRRQIVNDLHGISAFIMACIEYNGIADELSCK